MPIAVAAVAEVALAIILAIVLGIWLLFADAQGLSAPIPHVLCALAMLNAVAIFRAARGHMERAQRVGLWSAAVGGLLLLTIAANPVYTSYLFPPADNFLDLLKPLEDALMTLAALSLAALFSLAGGWGTALLSRARNRLGRPELF